MCFNVDSKLAAELITGAVGQENWEVEIKGKASHAGVAPEKGISATLVAAVALAEAHRGGWFGKVVKPEGQRHQQRRHLRRQGGKPAGDATNVVTDYVSHQGRGAQPRGGIRGDHRRGLSRAFAKAQAEVKDAGGDDRRSEIRQHSRLSAVQPVGRATPVVRARQARRRSRSA